jgi:diacylglycerol kinase family enzyme
LLTVVLNPASGTRGAADAPRVAELFRAEHVDVKIVTLEPARADAVIREAVAGAHDTVVAAGGDGTVSSVAGALAGTGLALGVLPCGTLNHFAKDLHIPLDAAAAVKTIIARHVVKVDVGYVNERVFINNSSIGTYPDVVQIREALRRQGRNKWMALAIATARVLQRGEEVLVRIKAEGRHGSTRTPFLFVGNNEYTIEGLSLGARARLDAGRLYAYLTPRLHTRELPKLLLWALLGRARQHSAFLALESADMWIETPHRRTIPVSTDGEVTTLPMPLHYRAAPGALNVIVPAG